VAICIFHLLLLLIFHVLSVPNPVERKSKIKRVILTLSYERVERVAVSAEALREGWNLNALDRNPSPSQRLGSSRSTCPTRSLRTHGP